MNRLKSGSTGWLWRIAAACGDTVCINRKTGEIAVNDIFAADVVYIVPEGHFFVTGDNADESKDSRYWEEPFISYDKVLARFG